MARFRHQSLRRSLLSVLAAGGVATSLSAQCTYEIQAIIQSPVFPNKKPTPHSLNNRGHACGIYGSGYSWFWSPESGFVHLEIPGISYANHINEADQIAGSLIPMGQGGYRPFRWQAGVVDVLIPLPPFADPDFGTPGTGVGRAIDADGNVIGSWGNSADPYVDAFRWMPRESFEAVPETMPLISVDPQDCTADGWFCGWCHTSDERGPTQKRGFVSFGKDQLVVLPPVPGGYTSEASGMSSNGYVVGRGLYTAPGGQTQSKAFLWDGSMQEIGSALPGPLLTSAQDVNALGQVIGHTNNSTYLWQNGKQANLALLVSGVGDPLLSYSINDRGWIAARSPGLGVGLILKPIRSRSGDANIDCKVNAFDLDIIFEFWGKRYDLPEMPGDLNGDMTVDAVDLAMVLGDWDAPADR